MKFPFKSIAFIAFSVLAIFLISCKSDDDNPRDECYDVACPTVVVINYVSIKDENQEPVALDSYEVINIENGDVKTTSYAPGFFEYYQEYGVYPLNTGPDEIGQEEVFLFKGFINDLEVISSNYKVRRGCCGMELVSGDTNLVLE